MAIDTRRVHRWFDARGWPIAVSTSIQRNAFLLAVSVGAAAVAGTVISVVHSPDRTLEYVRELRWPVALVLLAFIFRRPISALLDRIESMHLPTPFGTGRIDSPAAGARPGELPPEASALPSSDEPDGDVQLVDAAAPEPPPPDEGDDEQSAQEIAEDLARWQEYADSILAQWAAEQENSALLVVLNAIFGAQLEFLGWLETAPDGVTAPAVSAWYDAYKIRAPNWGAFDLNALTVYLFREGLIEIAPTGNWVITDRGKRVLDLSRQLRFAQKTY